MDGDENPAASIELLVCRSAERLSPTSATAVALSASVANEAGLRNRVAKQEFNEGKVYFGRKRPLHGGEPNLPGLSEKLAKINHAFKEAGGEKGAQGGGLPPVEEVEEGGKQETVEEENKVDCQGGESQKPLPDIDSRGMDDHLLCGHYVVHIYNWYKRYECHNLLQEDFMAHQEQLNPAMRTVALDWVLEAHHIMRLKPETLFLSVTYMDRYLSTVQVMRKGLQLLAGTCLYLAAKYEEMCAPSTKDIVDMMESKHQSGEILKMEKELFCVLHGWFAVPTITIFLRRHVRSVEYEKNQEKVVYCEYLSELSLYEYDLLHKPASQVSAAIVMLARASFEEDNIFPDSLRAHSQCTYEEVFPLAVQLAEAVAKGQSGRSRNGRRLYVFEKFKTRSRFAVSERKVPVLNADSKCLERLPSG